MFETLKQNLPAWFLGTLTPESGSKSTPTTLPDLSDAFEYDPVWEQYLKDKYGIRQPR